MIQKPAVIITGAQGVNAAYMLNPVTQTFEQWLHKNKALFNIQPALSEAMLSL